MWVSLFLGQLAVKFDDARWNYDMLMTIHVKLIILEIQLLSVLLSFHIHRVYRTIMNKYKERNYCYLSQLVGLLTWLLFFGGLLLPVCEAQDVNSNPESRLQGELYMYQYLAFNM